MNDAAKKLENLQKEIIRSQRCPRLVEFRQKIAAQKRKAYRDWDYWGQPVPSFGTAEARLLIVGLAPGAHGANRTGRMFTGDSSGDFLYATLHRFDFCNQPVSRSRQDGLELNEAYITAALHCVPPGNKPRAEEKENCRDFLKQELALLKQLRVIVALGRIAWDAYLRARAELGWETPRPKPKFSHEAVVELEKDLTLIACYHPSRQNTQTGLLTREMFDSVFRRARMILDST